MARPKQASPARHPVKVAADRAAIARGLLEGKTLQVLALMLGISTRTVIRDAAALEAEAFDFNPDEIDNDLLLMAA